MDFIALRDVAIEAARSAGTLIREHLDKHVAVEIKETPSSYAAQVVTEVDKKCEQVILEYLRPSCTDYDLAILTEETEDDGSRFEKNYFWCIDPMDGTLAFINRYPGYAVSIALVAQDGTPLIGVIYDPSRDVLYSAVKDLGAYKDKLLWYPKPSNAYLTYVTDKKLSDTPDADVIEKLLVEEMNKQGLEGVQEQCGAGSVLNGILVLENGPACMMKLPKEEKGGGSLWDFAALTCIYGELGLPATDFRGRRLDLNKRGDCFMNEAGVFFGNYRVE